MNSSDSSPHDVLALQRVRDTRADTLARGTIWGVLAAPAEVREVRADTPDPQVVFASVDETPRAVAVAPIRLRALAWQVYDELSPPKIDKLLRLGIPVLPLPCAVFRFESTLPLAELAEQLGRRGVTPTGIDGSGALLGFGLTIDTIGPLQRSADWGLSPVAPVAIHAWRLEAPDDARHAKLHEILAHHRVTPHTTFHRVVGTEALPLEAVHALRRAAVVVEPDGFLSLD